jgi:TolA-binding protein
VATRRARSRCGGRITAEHADAPEAAEAELAWARALVRRGDRAAARARFEHLIVTYPESALVPIARRELEALGAGT